MSTIGSLGSYAAQLWHTRANPANQEQFARAVEEQQSKPSAATTAQAHVAADTGSSFDEEAFAKLKLALNNIASGTDTDTEDSSKTGKSASEQFQDWMNMTPGEKLRASILDELGITEEDLANMTPEARQNVEAGIAEKVQTLFAQQVHENRQEYRADHGDSAEEIINLSV